MRRIGVTGSRFGGSAEQLSVLRATLAGLYQEGATLHHGCATGIDEAAHWIGRDIGYRMEFHPPLRREYLAGELLTDARDGEVLHPRADYLDRNRAIVAAVDHLVAVPNVPEKLRSGTWYTYRHAVRAGVRTTLIPA